MHDFQHVGSPFMTEAEQAVTIVKQEAFLFSRLAWQVGKFLRSMAHFHAGMCVLGALRFAGGCYVSLIF